MLTGYQIPYSSMTVQLHLLEALLASDLFLVGREMVRALTAKGVSVRVQSATGGERRPVHRGSSCHHRVAI